MNEQAKSAATAFMEEHERLQNELKTAHATIDSITKEATELFQRATILEDLFQKERDRADKFMRYAVELGAQLRFTVAGVVRGVQIADEVQRELTAAKVPPVKGADAADMDELRDILNRRPATAWDDGSNDRRTDDKVITDRHNALSELEARAKFEPVQQQPPLTGHDIIARASALAHAPAEPPPVSEYAPSKPPAEETGLKSLADITAPPKIMVMTAEMEEEIQRALREGRQVSDATMRLRSAPNKFGE